MDEQVKYWASGPKCSVREAAELLGVSVKTLRRMVWDGQLIAWRANPHGRKWLLYRRQVEGVAVVEQRAAVKRAAELQREFDFFNGM